MDGGISERSRLSRRSYSRVMVSCQCSGRLRRLVQARKLANPPCSTCSGMGASVTASSATKGSPRVRVLGITKAVTIRTQPRMRRPSAWPPRHARRPAAYTTAPRLTAAPIVQPSTCAWSSPPSCRPSTAIPIALTAVASRAAASRTRCWPGSLSRRIHGPPRRPNAQTITPARKAYTSRNTGRSLPWAGNLTVSVGARWLGACSQRLASNLPETMPCDTTRSTM